MALGGLLSIGGSLLGGLFDGDGGVGDANAANALLNRQIMSMLRELRQNTALNFRDAQQAYQERADAVMGDLDRADAQVGSIERNAQRGATQRRDQQQAALQQQLTNSGLGNSSIAANLARGVNIDYENNLGSIASQTAGLRSGLAGQRAGFRSAVTESLARLPLLRDEANFRNTGLFTSALENMAHVPSGQTGQFSNLFGDLGGALGDLSTDGTLGGILGGIRGIFG